MVARKKMSEEEMGSAGQQFVFGVFNKAAQIPSTKSLAAKYAFYLFRELFGSVGKQNFLVLFDAGLNAVTGTRSQQKDVASAVVSMMLYRLPAKTRSEIRKKLLAKLQ